MRYPKTEIQNLLDILEEEQLYINLEYIISQ